MALKSGLVKVTFECGAEVVLQGPCDFELQTPMVGFLKSGKITANVPHRAFSFAIHRPKVDFVDLGTAFGVPIGSSGNTELHVFEGEVFAAPRKKTLTSEKSQSMSPPLMHLNSGDWNVTEQYRDRQGKFSGLINLRQRGGEQPKELVSKHLALWLSADRGVATDRQRSVVSWQDILYGDNLSAKMRPK